MDGRNIDLDAGRAGQTFPLNNAFSGPCADVRCSAESDSEFPCPPEPAPRQSPKVLVVRSAAQLPECSVLQRETLLALDCEGWRLGRMGTLSLIQVGTESGDAFLFDVLDCPRNSEVVQWLKAILESTAVTKIVHDCRMDSDALYHLLGITLAEVHDTQACGGGRLNLNDTLQMYA